MSTEDIPNGGVSGDANESQEASPETPIPLDAFLEGTPPGIVREVQFSLVDRQTGYSKRLSLPTIVLHCSECEGPRNFSSRTDLIVTHEDNLLKRFVTYTCQNCVGSDKLFALAIWIAEKRMYKFGEMPSFGPPTPKRALKLIGKERELFFKGRRCELQGLGIAAFTYYRRVIESQKNKIFDEMIKVISKTDPSNEVLEELEAAKNESQFSNSVDRIKHALPSTLKVNGHNPLRLLYSALSEGVHSYSDDECLNLATAIREVLFEFSERLSQALNDSETLAKAISVLSQTPSRKGA